MSATLTEIRDALATVLDAIPGLRATAHIPGQVSPPVAVVAPNIGPFLTYDDATNNEASSVRLRVTVLAGSPAERSTEHRMDAFLSPAGTSSIRAAVSKDPTLGGVVDDAAVETANGYGVISYARADYLGCHLICSVLFS